MRPLKAVLLRPIPSGPSRECVRAVSSSERRSGLRRLGRLPGGGGDGLPESAGPHGDLPSPRAPLCRHTAAWGASGHLALITPLHSRSYYVNSPVSSLSSMLTLAETT